MPKFDPIYVALFIGTLLFIIGIFDYGLHRLRAANFAQLIILFASGFFQLYAGVQLFDSHFIGEIKRITGLTALIPLMMDLKGNVEITMASRMSTIANTTDRMRTLRSTGVVMRRNAILVQCQVTIVSIVAIFVVSAFELAKTAKIAAGATTNATTIATTIATATTIEPAQQSPLDLRSTIILATIAICTTTITCTILGSIITLAIYWLSRSGYDPDDMATSIAASVGDLVTIVMIGSLAKFFGRYISVDGCAVVLAAVVLIIFPVLMFALHRDADNREKFASSMTSIMIATAISLISGLIFEHSNAQFAQICLLGPVFTGFVGNSISIITSLSSTAFERINRERMATKIDPQKSPISSPSSDSFPTTEIDRDESSDRPSKPLPRFKEINWFLKFDEIFCYYDICPKVSMSCRSHLLHATLPCQFVYLLAVRTFAGETSLIMTPLFMTLYLAASFVLLAVMIILTMHFLNATRKLRYDPDETVIPILTSVGDFCGTMLLWNIYRMLRQFGDPNSFVQSTS